MAGLSSDFAARVGGRVLGQMELMAILQRQKQGQMTTVEDQRNLRRTFLEKVAQNHPEGVPAKPFDMSNSDAQEMSLAAGSLNAYNIGRYLAAFEKLAPKATAGLRETFDVVDWNNPNYMYNPVFLAFLVEAEARFIKDLHAQKAETMRGWDLGAKAAEIEGQLSLETVAAVREIFGGRTMVEILTLLRDKPLKVMGKEVRPQTDEMLELEARIMAANGITVVTTENFTDTTNIYLNSFLCFLLGSDGGTYYTPSHSSVYVLGRKALAGDGAQLLPEVYDGFIRHLKAIHAEAQATGYTIHIAAKKDPNILNTLTYERAARLFKEAMAPNLETIAMINAAAERGFRITLNTLSGSAAKSLIAQLKAFGINTDVFEPLWAEEDSYFNAGYVVAQKGDQLFVDHLGVDTSAPKVVRQIPYAEVLRDAPVCRMVYECDPDNDRFVVKQVLTEDSIGLCEAFGIDYYKLGNGKILAAPSPNKTFLLLDIADYEREKASGNWEKYQWLYFPTYVSSAAWVEFAKYLETREGNVDTFLCRVGFKNFNQALAKIQDWWFNHPEQATLTIEPQLGEAITLDRSKPLRVLSKEEESGGRTAGVPKPLMNILGQQVFSLPEKAVGDALMAHLADMSRRFLGGEEMTLPKVVEAAYAKYGLVSKIDYRLDILHGDQGIIAQVGPQEADRLKGEAGAQKSNFNTFFFSIAKAMRDDGLTLDQAKGILKTALPTWADTWDCIDQIMFVEEELKPGEYRPEGVMMTFSARDGKTPLVTQFKFRPSGTDPLKSKVYIDAAVLGPEQIAMIEGVFNTVKEWDLYGVLDHYRIRYAEPKPAEVAGIVLKPVQLVA